MFELTQTFTNRTEGSITPIRFKDQIIFLCQEVGPALGYADLARSITNSPGMRENKEFLTITGDNLVQLRDLLRRSATTPQISPMTRSLVVLTRPGLQKLVLRSDKPECIEFTDWVVYDVLPKVEAIASYKGTREYQRESLSAMYASLQKLKDKTSDSAKELLSWVARATDYVPSSKESNLAFAKIQNIVHMVATGKSAGEIRMERAESGQIHCGLRSGIRYNTRGDLDKKASEVARNFLDDNELSMEEAFFQMVVGRLNFDIMRDGVKYTIDEFTDFCYECAEVLRGQIEVQRMKTKYHKSKKEVNNYTHRQVGKYNADLALRDEGREVHLLEQKKLLLITQDS